MKLKAVKNIDEFKSTVKETINFLRKSDVVFDKLFDLLINSGQLFVIGGFLRNIINDRTDFRDIDLISSLQAKALLDLLKGSGIVFTVNRLGGLKFATNSIGVDMWSIHSNWSFSGDRIKIDLAKNYRSDVLIKKIADGTFYNFDSLVLDLKTYKCSVSNYNAFVKTQRLDILRKSARYKYQNPTREANILRAYFIYKIYNVELSEATKAYILNELSNLRSLKFEDGAYLVLQKSIDYREKYNAVITATELAKFLTSVKKDMGPLFNSKSTF